MRALTLALLVVVGLFAGCGDSGTSSSDSSSGSGTSSPQAPEALVRGQIEALFQAVSQDDVKAVVPFLARRGDGEDRRYVAMTGTDREMQDVQRVRSRVAQNNNYFYPQTANEAAKDVIKVEAELITQADGPFADVDALIERVTQQFQTDTTVTRLPMGPGITFRRATQEQMAAVVTKPIDDSPTQPTSVPKEDDHALDDTVSTRDDNSNSQQDAEN